VGVRVVKVGVGVVVVQVKAEVNELVVSVLFDSVTFDSLLLFFLDDYYYFIFIYYFILLFYFIIIIAEVIQMSQSHVKLLEMFTIL